MTANGRIDIYAKTASYLLNSGGGMQYLLILLSFVSRAVRSCIICKDRRVEAYSLSKNLVGSLIVLTNSPLKTLALRLFKYESQ